MKNIKKIIIVVITSLALQSCEKEKIVVEELEGYYFVTNPKNSTMQNVLNDVLVVVNRGQEQIAQKNGDSIYNGLGYKDRNGKVEMPKLVNTDYMLVFNEQEFEKLVEKTNPYSEKPKSKIDFKTTFVFVLIHPSKNASGIQFFDGLEAQVDDENNIKITPSCTEIPYMQNENSMYNYGENDCQVHLFKIPKSNFKTINIEWETGEKETLKMEK